MLLDAVDADFSSAATFRRLRGGTVPAALASVSPARRMSQQHALAHLRLAAGDAAWTGIQDQVMRLKLLEDNGHSQVQGE